MEPYEPCSTWTRGRQDAARFERVQPDAGGCWIWTGKCDRGYGRTRLHGRVSSAHRWMYEYTIGPIPAGLSIDHLCRVTKCVNPAHLEAVSQGENNRRAFSARTVGTHLAICKRGHEMTAENTRIRRGAHECKECSRENWRRWNSTPPDELQIATRDRTHCIRNHEFTDLNTRVNSRGARVCRTCERERVYAREESLA